MVTDSTIINTANYFNTKWLLRSQGLQNASNENTQYHNEHKKQEVYF